MLVTLLLLVILIIAWLIVKLLGSDAQQLTISTAIRSLFLAAE